MDKQMKFEFVKPLIDYLIILWSSELNHSYNKPIYVSFYGGEPLLNFNFIQNVVSYLNNTKTLNGRIIFSMTTNAILLKKYIDFFVDNSFQILISIDGNRSNNSHRIFPNGRESFDIIKENIDYLYGYYPGFFLENINFNSVLHNKNSFDTIIDFFTTTYNKTPSINELNTSGIDSHKIKLFEKIFRNKRESIQSMKNKSLIDSLFSENPDVIMSSIFLYKYSGNFFRDYNDLLQQNEEINQQHPTGTCFPFSKKMFVTVNGKILPCERIGQQFELGRIYHDRIDLDFDLIANKYNEFYSKITPQCKLCKKYNTCTQCIYNIDSINSKEITCENFMNEDNFYIYVNKIMNILRDNKGLYDKIINKLILDF
jgi:uncharacterized protein